MGGPIEHGEQRLLPGFRVRDVHEGDRAEVLAMTANTWAFGDYIKWVFDDWIADGRGRFLVAEHIETGRLAAIDKFTFHSDREAWFEGLRVASEFRGHGLAAQLQKYMIEQVRQAGADTIRLLTSINNDAVHRIAYRDGFLLKSVVGFWKWTTADGMPAAPSALTLRQASVEEASRLFDWWLRSSAFRTAGLYHRNWSFSESNSAEWEQAAAEGRLLVVGDRGDWPLPPASVLITSDVQSDGGSLWIVAAVCAQATQWAPLMLVLLSQARSQGISEINGLFGRDPDAEAALRDAGLHPDEGDEPLCLFELKL